MFFLGCLMIAFSVGICVYFALKYGIVQFHFIVLGLLTATVVFYCLSLLSSGAFGTVMRGASALSLITMFVLACDKALQAYIHIRHLREQVSE